MYFPLFFLTHYGVHSIFSLFFISRCSKIICRFIHDVDPDGDVLETTFSCGDLAIVFGEFGEIEGELMGYIMSHWKIDSTYNHVYGNATRVLLSPYFMTVSRYVLLYFQFHLPYYFSMRTAF